MRLLYTLREEMSTGSASCRSKREDLEAGQGKMRGVWNLRRGVPEESDRAKRMKMREEFQINEVLPLFLADRFH